VASDLRSAVVELPAPALGDLAGLPVEMFDRVRRTAEDRPPEDSLPPMVDPAADHDPPGGAGDGRRADVEAKHDAIRRFLDRKGYDAVILGRADSIAWFTAGGDLTRDLCSERASAMVFVNRNNRAVLTDNVHSARIFEEEVAGLGFQLKERAWYDAPERLAAELGHNRRVAADFPLAPFADERAALGALRRRLSARERDQLRDLGQTLALAVEATCRNFDAGETEADVAGHLAHRLLREGVVPVDLRVASDDRLARFRQPSFKAAPIRKHATIAVVGRRHGLCAGLTRTVSMGPVDPAFADAHQLAAMVDATCLFFSRPGESVREVFRRARRIYEKFGHPDEWVLDYQGCLTGFAPVEELLVPESDLTLESELAVRWSPSVGAARSEDTIVVDARGGFEVMTDAQVWPKLEIMVKGFPILRPGILERHA
jgi:Xaa-Pro aminopeptidase